VTGVWTYALGRLFSLGGLARLGFDTLPLLPVSWPLALTVVGMLVAFILAFLGHRFLGAPTRIWIGALVGALLVSVPALQHAIWAAQHSNDLFFIDAAPGGTPVETAIALVGYPAVTWAACRMDRVSEPAAESRRA